MNYNEVFTRVMTQLKGLNNMGQVAQYIPELSNVNPDCFGVYLLTTGQQSYSLGDSKVRFSIQSISKVIALIMAYKKEDANLWSRVGVEPSGTPFNSNVQLEFNQGIPRNPMLNTGAIVVCDILLSLYDDPKKELLNFFRKLTGNNTIGYSTRIVESERAVGYKNISLANLIKSYGNIHNDVDEVLDFYFNLCSIELSCSEVSRMFLFLANNGVDPFSQEEILSFSKTKRINAIMQLCGFYDEAGEFAFKVGLPGKSGVGGGIMAVHPGSYCITVWSPPLNEKGNSFMGMKFLELFTTETQASIF